MEKDEQKTLRSTSTMRYELVKEDVVAAGTASATKTIEGEQVAALREDKKAFASDELIRAVFSNSVVRLQLHFIQFLINPMFIVLLCFCRAFAVTTISRYFISKFMP